MVDHVARETFDGEAFIVLYNEAGSIVDMVPEAEITDVRYYIEGFDFA